VKPKVLSIQIGHVKSYGTKDTKNFDNKFWQTAAFKEPLSTPVYITKNGILGDEVADTKHHGGIDKAVFANSYENYSLWSKYLNQENLPFGALSENLTLTTLHETNVCLGDVHLMGKVILRVSQPRKPCWKISQRWLDRGFTKEIYDSKLSGWYYSVMHEGILQKGEDVEILQKGLYQISIFEANEAYKNPHENRATLEKILEIPNLAESYYESIEKRLLGKADLEYMNVAE